MRDVTFGQYYPAQSPVHRCDPRTKILFLIVYIAAIFTAKNFYGLAACAAVFDALPARTKARPAAAAILAAGAAYGVFALIGA